jgi:hypothetical protein
MPAQSCSVQSCVRSPPSLGRRPCTGVGGGGSVRPVGAGLGASECVFKMFAVHVWSKLNRRGREPHRDMPGIMPRLHRGRDIVLKGLMVPTANIESNKKRKHMHISAETVLLGESAPTWCDNELCTLHDEVVRSIISHRSKQFSLFHGDLDFCLKISNQSGLVSHR